MNNNCKASKDGKMDCNDDCNGGLDCKNKRVQKCLWKKVEVRHSKMVRVAAFLQWKILTKMFMSQNTWGKLNTKKGEQLHDED